ncbi:MAG: NAD-dependent epimerase/dehydratase family protein [Acidimicrobiales bacterium]
MAIVVVTGAAGSVGSRLVPLLAFAGHEVVAVDRSDVPDGTWPSGVRAVVADVRSTSEWMPTRADAVVHLALPLDGSAADTTRAVLGAARGAAAVAFVHRSSALVYGAWDNNQVPLTEDAPLRPNPEFAPAADLAEAERLIAAWESLHVGVAVAVLRPTTVLAPGDDQLTTKLFGPDAYRRAEPPVVQFLAVDDLVGAIIHCLDQRLDGVFNVAPNGWIGGSEVLALGGGFRLPVPDAIRSVASRVAFKVGLSARPPSTQPWLRHPWVIASDRLVASGWKPSSTNEEAVVAARRGAWWREMSPNRRQEVTLAASGATLAAGVAAAVGIARRSRRR